MPFFERWREDVNRKEYLSVDFLPAPIVCPPETLNIFKPFWFHRHIPKLAKNECQAFIDRFYECGKNIVGGKNETQTEQLLTFVLRYIANLITRPAYKSKVCLVFYGVQGSGKSLFWDIVGKMIGNNYYSVISNPEKVFDKFNSSGANKFLAVLNEFPLDGKKYADVMKDKITEEYDWLELKGKDPVKVRNNTNYVILTNHSNCVKVEDTDRRYMICQTGPKQSDDFYKPLYESKDNKDYIYHLLHDVMQRVKLPETGYNFLANIPASFEKQALKELNYHPRVHFLQHLYESATDKTKNITKSSDDLYAEYKAFREANGYKADSLETKVSFGVNLKNDKELTEVIKMKHTRTGNMKEIVMTALKVYIDKKFPADVCPEEDKEEETTQPIENDDE